MLYPDAGMWSSGARRLICVAYFPKGGPEQGCTGHSSMIHHQSFGFHPAAAAMPGRHWYACLGRGPVTVKCGYRSPEPGLVGMSGPSAPQRAN